MGRLTRKKKQAVSCNDNKENDLSKENSQDKSFIQNGARKILSDQTNSSNRLKKIGNSLTPIENNGKFKNDETSHKLKCDEKDISKFNCDDGYDRKSRSTVIENFFLKDGESGETKIKEKTSLYTKRRSSDNLCLSPEKCHVYDFEVEKNEPRSKKKRKKRMKKAVLRCPNKSNLEQVNISNAGMEEVNSPILRSDIHHQSVEYEHTPICSSTPVAVNNRTPLLSPIGLKTPPNTFDTNYYDEPVAKLIRNIRKPVTRIAKKTEIKRPSFEYVISLLEKETEKYKNEAKNIFEDVDMQSEALREKKLLKAFKKSRKKTKGTKLEFENEENEMFNEQYSICEENVPQRPCTRSRKKATCIEVSEVDQESEKENKTRISKRKKKTASSKEDISQKSNIQTRKMPNEKKLESETTENQTVLKEQHKNTTNICEKKAPRRSYTRSRKRVNFKDASGDEDSESEKENKPTKTQGKNKALQEEDELALENWAKAFNQQCMEVEKFDLYVE